MRELLVRSQTLRHKVRSVCLEEDAVHRYGLRDGMRCCRRRVRDEICEPETHVGKRVYVLVKLRVIAGETVDVDRPILQNKKLFIRVTRGKIDKNENFRNVKTPIETLTPVS